MDRKLEKVYEIPLKSGGKARVTISAEDAPSEAADAAELLRQYGEHARGFYFDLSAFLDQLADEDSPYIPAHRPNLPAFQQLNDTAAHFGYAEVANRIGHWPVDSGTLERLKELPEILDAKKKTRIIFDYDPSFPRALLQVFEG